MFKKAERKQVKLKLALTGPSGSGKTKSALYLATGLGKKIAFIDTENGSASLYAKEFDFDVAEIIPPYTVEKYQQAIEGAEKAGYDVIIIDSITHSWAGEGGLLDQKEQLDARGKGNSFTNWASITKRQEEFKNHILHSPCHIICTMRSKQEYIMQDKDGKQVPKKVGMAPIQRDGIEYEFTVVFDIAMNHEAEASKDRTGMYANKIFKITKETGLELDNWLNSGLAQAFERKPDVKPPVEPPKQRAQAPAPVNNSIESASEIGDYIMTKGTVKVKNIKLSEISKQDLEGYLKFFDTPTSGPAAKSEVLIVKKWLAISEKLIPKLNTNEELR